MIIQVMYSGSGSRANSQAKLALDKECQQNDYQCKKSDPFD